MLRMLTLLLVAGLLLTGCKRNDDKGAEAATPRATGSAPAARPGGTPTSRDLARGLLSLEDLPPDWIVVKRQPPQAQDERTTLCGVEHFYGQVTKSLGEFANARSATDRVITHGATAYAPGDAKQSIDDTVALLQTCKEWQEKRPDGTIVNSRISPVTFPQLGEQSVAFRVDTDGPTGPIQLLIVVLRRGDLTSGMIATAIRDRQLDRGLVELLARRSDERLQAIAGR